MNKVSRGVQIYRRKGLKRFLVELFWFPLKVSSRFLGTMDVFVLLKRNPFAFVGVVTERFFGFDVYLDYLKKRNEDCLVVKDIDGYGMILDLEDEGISRDLLRYGIREAEAFQAFKSELVKLKDKEEVVVLELGANIGYYALLEASVLGDSACVYAFEPSPRNVVRLEENIELNGFEDVFRVLPFAVGSEEGTVDLEVSSSSNLCRVEGVSDKDVGIEESVEVDVFPVDSFLEKEGLSPEDVDVVRMDVEGFEYEVLKGMKSVLECSSPLVLFVEVHRGNLSDSEREEFVGWLQDNGFEVVHSSTNFRETDVSFDDLRDLPRGCPEVIFKRGESK